MYASVPLGCRRCWNCSWFRMPQKRLFHVESAAGHISPPLLIFFFACVCVAECWWNVTLISRIRLKVSPQSSRRLRLLLFDPSAHRPRGSTGPLLAREAFLHRCPSGSTLTFLLETECVWAPICTKRLFIDGCALPPDACLCHLFCFIDLWGTLWRSLRKGATQIHFTFLQYLTENKNTQTFVMECLELLYCLISKWGHQRGLLFAWKTQTTGVALKVDELDKSFWQE